MKRLLFLLLVIISLSPFHARATHILGADISYKYISTNAGVDTYQVTLVIWRNCQSTEHATDFPTYTPVIHVFDTSISQFPPQGDPNIQEFLLANISDSTKDVSPYCSTIMLNQTDCTNPNSLIPGIYRFVYRGNILIPHKSNSWEIAFVSNLVGCNDGDEAGKAICINSYDDQHNNAVAIAMLNNSIGNNNSPIFNNTVSNTYFPTNTPATYIENAVDPDHDSLYYQMDKIYTRVDANKNNPNCYNAFTTPGPPPSIVYGYNPTYSETNPIDVQSGSYNFNSANGNISFFPISANDYSICTRTTEYRNGVVVGSIYRQVVFVILNSSGALLPGHIDTTTVTGANTRGLDSLYACPGNTISFQVPIYDSIGGVTHVDTVQTSFSDIIGGSNVSVSNNNTKNATLSFSWNTTGAKYGVYTITPNFKIFSCPLPAYTSHTYTIIIGDAGIVTATPLSPTYCLYKAKVAFNIQNGYNGGPNVPYKLTLTQGADTLKSYSDTASNIYDSLATGSYTLILRSQGLPCTSHIDFTISDSGPYPYKPTGIVDSVEYCKDGKDSALVAHLDSNANYLKWYESSLLNVIPGPVTPATAVPGTYIYYVSQVYKTCESAVDTIVAIIDQNVCDYDVNIHNVITPNGDGHNDVWEIENLKFYPDTKVEIFDKLGDKVYEKTHYAAPWWDGGSLPSGVYYYTVDLGKPNIVTGKQRYTGYIMIKR